MLAGITLIAAPILPQRAVLVTLAQKSEGSVYEQELILDALLRRGWSPGQIELCGRVDSIEALDRILGRFSGGILYVSGVSTLRPNPKIQLGTGSIDVELLMAKLKGKPSLLLPDFGFTNLIYSLQPSGISTIVSTGSWTNQTQPRQVGFFEPDGHPSTQIGVLTAALWRALPFSTDVRDLANRINHHSGTASMAAMWSDLYGVQVLGSGLPVIPGKPVTPRSAVD